MKCFQCSQRHVALFVEAKVTKWKDSSTILVVFSLVLVSLCLCLNHKLPKHWVNKLNKT